MFTTIDDICVLLSSGIKLSFTFLPRYYRRRCPIPKVTPCAITPSPRYNRRLRSSYLGFTALTAVLPQLRGIPAIPITAQSSSTHGTLIGRKFQPMQRICSHTWKYVKICKSLHICIFLHNVSLKIHLYVGKICDMQFCKIWDICCNRKIAINWHA